MRRISILGATGSIGQSTLDLIKRAPTSYRVVALTGGQNIAQLAADARACRAEIAVTADPSRLEDLRAALSGSGIAAEAGSEALCAAAARPADWVMSAIVGAAGLAPGLAALEAGADLALANKESMVAAGPLVKRVAEAHGARLIPVDSEHSALAQALRAGRLEEVEDVTITASGGAFRDWTLEEMAGATPAEAATHPNWDMGQRITIDSASMFNKALEVIETHEFFDLPAARIKVLVHPQSIVHALVQYRDGGVIAHLGAPDMRHAIGHALSWPGRAALPVARLDLAELARLDFTAPDEERWPALRLAREVIGQGGHAGAVFNAAKEAALDAFLAGETGFLDMARLVEEVMALDLPEARLGRAAMTLETVHCADAAGRAALRARLSQSRH